MRTMFLAFGIALIPALAHAGIDFKCSDQLDASVTALMRFDFNGANGQIEIDRWDGYPPTVMVEAKIASSNPSPSGGVRLVSAPDSEGAAVATLDVPTDFVKSDRFSAVGGLRDGSPEKAKSRLDCVRQ